MKTGDNLKNINTQFLLAVVIIGIAILSYLSYSTGYKISENSLGSLQMMMTIDSNFVTTGIYEELPNNIKKTMQFYIEDTPTKVNDVKIFAQVKYITIGNEIVNIESGEIWNLIRKENTFQRQFPDSTKTKRIIKKNIPQSSLAQILILK